MAKLLKMKNAPHISWTPSALSRRRRLVQVMCGAVFLFSFVFVCQAKAQEIVVLTFAGQVISYDKSGAILSSFWPNTAGSLASRIAAGDVDGDKIGEVAVADGGGISVFSREGILKFSIKKDNAGADLLMADVDGDYRDEIIFHPFGDSRIYIYGKDGKLKKDFFLFSKSFRGSIIIAAADLNRDNKDEIIIVPHIGKEKRFFSYYFEKDKIFVGPKIGSETETIISMVGGDVEGDGKDEMALCGQNCRVSRLNGKETELYKWPDLGTNFIVFEDISSDGRGEVIFGKETGNISVYQLNSKAALASYFSVLGGIRDMTFLPIFKKEAKVIYVDDGDSIFLDSGEEIRYIGVDTPEIGEKNYLEATNKNKELVYGKTVQIEYDKQRVDPFGRQLAYVFCDEKFINEELIKSGLAKPKFIFPDVKYAERLEKASPH